MEKKILSIKDYVNKYSDYFPRESATNARALILGYCCSEEDAIDPIEVFTELKKVNPYLLTLLCNIYINYGYE